MNKTYLLPRILALVTLLSLQSCGDSDNSEPPAELVDFAATAELDEVWDASPNSGSGQQFVYLEPLVLDDKIVTAGRDGVIAEVDLPSGDISREFELGTEIGAGIGGDDNNWFVSDQNGMVYAIDVASGDIKWKQSVNSEVLATPALFGDSVYVRTVDGKLISLDAATGDNNWRYSKVLPALTLRGNATPIFTRDWVMIGQEDGHFAALDLQSGAHKWEVELSSTGGRSEIERLIDIDGTAGLYGQVLYAVSYQGRLAAVDIERGQVLWAKPFSSHTGVSVDDKAVYVTDERSHIWAIDRFNGATLWKQDALTARDVTRPVVFGEYLVVGDYAGVVHVLSKNDGSFIARAEAGDEGEGIFLPPVIHDDRIIVIMRDGDIASYKLTEKLAQQ